VPNSYNIDTIPVDTSANEETIALFNFLLRQFGHRILSGQTHDNYSTIKNLTGKSPLIRVGDMQPFTEGYPYIWVDGKHTFGKGDNGSVEALINWYNNSGKKGIVGYQWHWHSPTGGEAGTNTFYTNQTSFDIRQAVISGTPENLNIIRDIDDVSGDLIKFRDAGVPVLWRPLHEAGGGWFWWGAHGPEPCLALYNFIFDRMMNHHHLNNLIWIWSTPEEEWYPGNEKVDMIGYDSYPGNFNYGIQKNFFDQLYNITGGEKLIAMTENGPIPDIDECLRLDAPWLYFISWSNLVTEQNSIDHLNDVYNNPIVLTLESTNEVVPVSVLESSLIQPIHLWPNPVVDFLNCRLPDDGKNKMISITDMNGRKCLNFKPNQNNFSLDIRHLPSGIYLFHYVSSESSQKSLFIKN
jgi:mannan endo-1,4-beta-mannosidase